MRMRFPAISVLYRLKSSPGVSLEMVVGFSVRQNDSPQNGGELEQLASAAEAIVTISRFIESAPQNLIDQRSQIAEFGELHPLPTFDALGHPSRLETELGRFLQPQPRMRDRTDFA